MRGVGQSDFMDKVEEYFEEIHENLNDEELDDEVKANIKNQFNEKISKVQNCGDILFNSENFEELESKIEGMNKDDKM